jgi:hypothetical protein
VFFLLNDTIFESNFKNFKSNDLLALTCERLIFYIITIYLR